MSNLNVEKLESTSKLPVESIFEAALANQDISDIDDLSRAQSLKKLFLRGNNLDNPGLRGLSTTPQLTLLNLSENKLTSFKHLECLVNLVVLNLSFNQLDKITSHLTLLVNLRALMLNNNQIRQLENTDSLTKLTALILSHNQLDNIHDIHSLKELSKISATHNRITSIPNIKGLLAMKEIRLAHNRITCVDQDIGLDVVEILDLGHNSIDSLEDLKGLENCGQINQLNLRGNKVCLEKDYKNRILTLLPKLRVLDGVRFDERFKDRKEKRKVMSVKHEKRHKLLTTSDGINEPYKEKKYGDIPQKLKIQQKKPLKMCERELIGGDEQTCNNEIRVQQDKDDEKSDVIKVVVEEKIKRINPFDEQTKTTKKQKVCQKELEEDEDTIQVNKKLLSGVVGIVEGNKRRTKKTNSDITTFTPKSLDAKNVEDIIGGWD